MGDGDASFGMPSSFLASGMSRALVAGSGSKCSVETPGKGGARRGPLGSAPLRLASIMASDKPMN